MKKRITGIAAALLAMAMGLSLFGCNSEPVDANQNVVNAKFNEKLSLVRIGSVDRGEFSVAEGGLFYRENGKYGIMSRVGLHDTGAVYAYLSEKGSYFAVSKKEINDSTKVADLNSLSLVDGNGNVLLSDYANYYMLDNRYAVAYTVTERCYREDLALMSYDDGIIYSQPNSKCNMFAGTWCIYDLKTGKKVPGISGDKAPSVLDYGDLFKYETEDGSWVTMDANGNAISGRIFEDGSYAFEGAMYTPEGVKLFDYDADVYSFYSLSDDGDYYIVSRYKDDNYDYVVMDKTGKTVSKAFSNVQNVDGGLLLCDGKVYDFDGNNVISGDYDSLEKDPMFGGVWMLRKDQTYTIINEKGEVFYNGTDNDDYTIVPSDYVAYQKKDDDHYFYSHKDQDYTINGISFSPWLVRTYGTDYTYNLVDTMTGETMLEGYPDYSYNALTSFAYYVYAKYDGGADVYLVVSGSQLEEVEKVKNDLLEDLVAAFEDEGIEVTIDKETGAMSLGSDILFQPDKAELTAQGKADLTKFLRAYTKVAFSEKYEGFINKTIIEGHVAPDGDSYASGMALSEQRADVVLQYCLSAGSEAGADKIQNAIQAIGYSNGQPVYNEDGSVNMEKSRRVSFRFMMNIEF